MALAPLATVADLSTYEVDTTNTALVEKALDAASEAVREAAGGPISEQTSTFSLVAPQSQWLDLPMSPVTEVTTVTADSEAVTDFVLADGRLWRSTIWAARCDRPTLVEVTATYGYAEVPADVVLLVCELATAVILAATEAGIAASVGVAGESVDDYAVQFVQGDAAVASILEIPEGTRLRLRRRFGQAVAVTGERS